MITPARKASFKEIGDLQAALGGLATVATTGRKQAEEQLKALLQETDRSVIKETAL
jgi:hypothetical protein